MNESGHDGQKPSQERKEQNQESVYSSFFRKAVDISANTDQKPIFTLAELINTNPRYEWDEKDYAKVISHFTDIEGSSKDKKTASDIRQMLHAEAAKEGISPQKLSEALSDVPSEKKTLDDVYSVIETNFQALDPDAAAPYWLQLRELVEDDAPARAAATSQQSAPLSLEEEIDNQMNIDLMQRQQLATRQRAKENQEKKKFINEQGEDEKLYIGTIAETIEKRFEKIMNPDDPDKDRFQSYFADIQRWVGTVLKNDVREGGKLKLLSDRYEAFREIMDLKSSEMTIPEMQEKVAYLRDKDKGRLTNYFVESDGSESNRLSNLLGYSTESQLPQLPTSVEETMDIIQAQFGSQFATGGEYELMDINGNFHIENFYYWARWRTNWLREQNPTDAINPLSDITIRTQWQSLPIAEILQSPQFRKHVQYEIIGDETKDDGKIHGKWGSPTDHPQFTEERTLDLLYELAFYSKDHSTAAEWFTVRGDKDTFLKGAQVHVSSWMSRGNWMHVFKRPSRHKGSSSEFEQFYKNDADGTLGRALREMVAAYSHITEFTDFHTYQEGDRRFALDDGVKREVGKRKFFKDNLFYTYLEANGTNAFLNGISESVLTQRSETLSVYRDFLKEQMDRVGQAYAGRDGLTEENKKLLAQLTERYMKKCDGASEVSFDSPKEILDFHTQVSKLVFGIKVNEDVKESIQQGTQRLMLQHLKSGFFSKLKEIELYTYDDKTGRQSGTITLGKAVESVFDDFDDSIENYEKYVDYKRLGKEDPNITDAEFEKYVEKNEKLALKLAEVLLAQSRTDLNYFRKAEFHFSKQEILDKALRKGVAVRAFGLDEEESKYASSWAKNMLYGFGIAGENDTSNTGFDYWTRISRAGKYMAAQDTKGYPIVKAFINEVEFLGSNVFDMLVIKNPGQSQGRMTMMDIFMGGAGVDIKSRNERLLGKQTDYVLSANAQQGVFLNNIRNAAAFIDQLRNAKFDFDGITFTDHYGNVVVDKQKAISEFTKLWTVIRYSTDQHGMEYSRLMSRDGKIDDVMHCQFGKKTRSMLEDIRDNVYPHDPGKVYKSPGVGLFMSLMASIVNEHRGTATGKHWTIQQLNELETVIVGVIHGDHKEKLYGTRVPPMIWNSMLSLTKEGGYRKMMIKEGWWSLFTSVLFALAEGGEEMLEEVGRPLK